jgi:ABC-type lipopolysaccharide export system ATPase subunit
LSKLALFGYRVGSLEERLVDRGYVLETGRLVAEGNPEALWNNDELRAAYLGGRKMLK